MTLYEGSLRITGGTYNYDTRWCRITYSKKRTSWRFEIGTRNQKQTKFTRERDFAVTSVRAVEIRSSVRFRLTTGGVTYNFDAYAGNDLLLWCRVFRILVSGVEITSSAPAMRATWGNRGELPIHRAVKEKKIANLPGRLDRYISCIGPRDSDEHAYLISRKQFRGAFGKVIFGIPLLGTGTTMYAIKKLKAASWGGSTKQEIANELHKMQEVDSPVQVFDVLELDKKYYCAMPLGFDGLTMITSWKSGALKLPEVWAIGRHALHGLSEMLAKIHAKGYLFRDLKPGNMMYAESGFTLIDYGSVTPLKDWPRNFGSPGYSAPELICKGFGKDQYDNKVDVFALGITCLELMFLADGHHYGGSVVWPAIESTIVEDPRYPLNAIWKPGGMMPNAAGGAKYVTYVARLTSSLAGFWDDVDTGKIKLADTPSGTPEVQYIHGNLGFIQKDDPELFKLLWATLCPDPQKRPSAAQVFKEATQLLSKGADKTAIGALTRVLPTTDEHKRRQKILDVMLEARRARQAAPWDAPQVRANLRVLAGLKKGDRLLVLTDQPADGWRKLRTFAKHQDKTGNRDLLEVFAVQRTPSKVEINTRKDAGESLFTSEQYALPLGMLFRSAVALYKRRHETAVRKTEITAAFAGLERMLSGLAGGFRKSAEYTQVAAIVEMVWYIINSGEGLVRDDGFVEFAGTANVELLTHPVLRKLRESIIPWLKLVEVDALTKEATVKATDLETVFGKSPTVTPTTTLPVGSAFQRQGLGICAGAFSDWGIIPVSLNTQQLDLRSNNWPQSLRRLWQALGEDDAMLFCVSRLTCDSGLPSVIRHVFKYKYPKNLTRKKVKSVFCTAEKRIVPVAMKSEATITTTQGVQVTVIAKVAGNYGLMCSDQFLPELELESKSLDELRLSKLEVELTVRLVRDQGALTLTPTRMRLRSEALEG